LRSLELMRHLTRKQQKQILERKSRVGTKLSNKEDVAKELLKLNKKGVDEFLSSLSDSVSRFIERIIILPLHGQENSFQQRNRSN
jgi:hypothetical protein